MTIQTHISKNTPFSARLLIPLLIDSLVIKLPHFSHQELTSAIVRQDKMGAYAGFDLVPPL